MPAVTIDGEEYWAGRHPKFGLVVHAVRWQEGLPSDRVRLLVVSQRGPTLLVSPLLSLMRNQIEAARRMGVRAEMITSANRDDWPRVEAALDLDEVDILLIAPERFGNEHFRDQVLAGIADRVSLLVIDECHCISDWGHDFRPDYQRIERAARNLPRNMRLLATTATANDRVMKDLRNV